MALSRRLGITLQLSDYYPASRRSFSRNITRAFGGLFPNLLFLLRTVDDKGRGSPVNALGLGRGLSIGYELINGHLPPSHHGCILIDLSLCQLGYLSEGVLRFNRHVNSTAQRYALRRFVSHGCTVLYNGVLGAEIPSFVGGQRGREEVCVPNIYV